MSMMMTPEGLREEELMRHVIRDEETDEIIGIEDDLPEKDRKELAAILKQMESPVPLIKY